MIICQNLNSKGGYILVNINAIFFVPTQDDIEKIKCAASWKTPFNQRWFDNYSQIDAQKSTVRKQQWMNPWFIGLVNSNGGPEHFNYQILATLIFKPATWNYVKK